MRNTIYKVGSYPDLVQVAKRLNQKHEWSPVYWISSERNRDLISNELPNVTFHSKAEANRGIPPTEEFCTNYPPLDKHILNKYEKYQNTALRLMDRWDPGYNFNFDERVRHYHNLLRYWRYVVEKLDIDLAIFQESPSKLHDYILYAVCKEKNVSIVIIKYTKIGDYNYFQDSIHEPNEELCTKSVNKKGGGNHNVSSKSKECVKKIRGSYNESDYNDHRRTMIDHLKNWKKIPYYISKLRKRTTEDYKKKGVDIKKSWQTWGEYLLYQQKCRFYLSKLKREYNNISKKPSLNQKYIYFPLHFQPEKTTTPEANVYTNQYLIVDLLSHAVPDDWNIYVKEHPAQFELYHYAERGRSKYHYDDIDNIENAYLLDLDINQYKLIDNSMAVVTGTGTAGWEAVVRGTPAFIFGNPWYRCCNGVYHISDESDIKEVIDIIQNSNITDDDVYSYIAALEEVGHRAYYSEHRKQSDNISSEENIERICENLYSFVKNR